MERHETSVVIVRSLELSWVSGEISLISKVDKGKMNIYGLKHDLSEFSSFLLHLIILQLIWVLLFCHCIPIIYHIFSQKRFLSLTHTHITLLALLVWIIYHYFELIKIKSIPYIHTPNSSHHIVLLHPPSVLIWTNFI